jgi:hypothetical protein
MKWFKHFCSATDDELLADLMGEFGLEGYGFYFRVLEIIGSQLDEKCKTFLTFSVRNWAKKIGISEKKFKKISEFLKSQPEKFSTIESRNALCIITGDDNLLTIDVPNLLKIKDETLRKEVKKTGIIPEQVRNDSVTMPEENRKVSGLEVEEEVEVEEEREVNNNNFARTCEAESKPLLPSADLPGAEENHPKINDPPKVRALKFPKETQIALTKSKNPEEDFLRVVRGLENTYENCPFVLQQGLEHFAALAKPANATALIKMCDENARKAAENDFRHDRASPAETEQKKKDALRESALFQLRKGHTLGRIRVEVFQGMTDEKIRDICPELFLESQTAS